MDFWIGCELVHPSVTMVQILRAVGLMAAIIADEKPVQFFSDFRKGFRSKKDGVQYEDYQYIRNGIASISFLQSLWLVGYMPTPRKDGLLRIGQSR